MAQPKKRRRWLFALILVAVVAVVLAVVFGSSSSEAVVVTVERVARRTITQTVSATGVLRPETEVKLSSETSGEIIAVLVKEGDTVRRGQLLVRIRPDIAQTQLEQFAAAAEAAKLSAEVAKAELERARSELQRVSELYARNFLSRQELEQAQTLYQQALGRYQAALAERDRAQAALRQAQLQVSRTAIYAPIDGIVTSLSVAVGEKVVGTMQMQGTELLRIADLRRMLAVVEVNENDVTLLHVGDSATVTVDAIPRRSFRAVVTEIAHSPKRAKAEAFGAAAAPEEVVNFEVKLLLLDSDPRLRPGMSCYAEIRTETRHNVLAVPIQAVTVRAEERDTLGNARKEPPTIVFVHENGRARRVEVETGISDRDYIEIRKGLREGQEVISGSFHAITQVLKDGMPVQVRSSGSAQRK
jgi:HlyD family secretion protein